MKFFEQIKKEMDLKKFLASKNGTLYFPSDATKRIIVRHFDNELPALYIPIYVELMFEMGEWLKTKSKLNQYLIIEQPIEVGTDFIARPHHIYYNSVRDYLEEDSEVKVPSEYTEMKKVFDSVVGKYLDEKESLISKVLYKSVFKPTGKTYLNENDKFVTVDPKFTKEDLDTWMKIRQK